MNTRQSTHSMIEFQNITKTYGSKDAVTNLDLSIEKGKITVFVGPSGCGKTTCLRMINRMVTPTRGTILIDGQDSSPIPDATLRRGMGYVLQQAGLMPHKTVQDNIATVPLLNGTPKKEARAAAIELLERVGLDSSYAQRYPHQLSGGQQQRVGVARALAADPPILLMDEAFSAVDPVVRDELQQEFLRLQSELGKTIVFVTHDIDEAVILGDKIAVFNMGGRIAQYDTPENILTNPADEYVSNFVGKDRGFRSLSFLNSTAPVTKYQTITPEDSALATPASHWRLITSSEGKPQGWMPPGESTASMQGKPLPGGTLYTEGHSLRSALDAALSSPSGLGVAVSAEGKYLGVVFAQDVIDSIALSKHDHSKPSGRE